MEYIYAGMLLHSAKKEITEENVSKVLEAAGVKADAGKVKGLVTSLKEVNIEDIIKNASAAPAAAPAAASAESGNAEKKDEKKEEKKTEEEAAAGLSSLFG